MSKETPQIHLGWALLWFSFWLFWMFTEVMQGAGGNRDWIQDTIRRHMVAVYVVVRRVLWAHFKASPESICHGYDIGFGHTILYAPLDRC